MAAELILQFTEAGMQKLVTAKGQNIKEAITHIALGDGGGAPYEMDDSRRFQTELVNEVDRVPVADKVDGHLELMIAGVFNSDKEYNYCEIGLFLADGTLLALFVASKMMYKSANFKFTYRAVVDLRPLPTDSVTVNIGVPNANLIMLQPIAIMTTAIIKSNTVVTKTAHEQFKILQLLREKGLLNG